MDNQFDLVPAAPAPVLADYEARVNVTYAALNGDLADAVAFDSTDAVIKAMLTEALRDGSVRGIPAQANPDLANYVIDRFPATNARPYALIQARPKTAFGG